MPIQIVGDVDKDRLFCAGSFTKLVTTYVSLSLLSERYDLAEILNDADFLDTICVNGSSKNWLHLFQNIVGGRFSLHDVCSYYAGLPYTFDVSEKELDHVEKGYPFKHHSILDIDTFMSMCHKHITPIYSPEGKFHYSELSIIFLGYLIEQVYDCKIEDLYQKYIIKKFKLPKSLFSRIKPADVYIQDLSDKYDYPSIAILDHGYFCFSNGFFTTLSDMKKLLEGLLSDPVFYQMTDIRNARAASNTIMNGLAIELRMVQDDIILGYEGLSYSGCNIWAYSKKMQQGYLTFVNDEEKAYEIYNLLGYPLLDKAPQYTQEIYKKFIKNYDYKKNELRVTPIEYQGDYQRVIINEKILNNIFIVGDHFIIIRDPHEIRFDLIYTNGNYHIKGKDNLPGAKVGFVTSKNGLKYMYYNGTLYVKI
jgi:hypothetical protein